MCEETRPELEAASKATMEPPFRRPNPVPLRHDADRCIQGTNDDASISKM